MNSFGGEGTPEEQAERIAAQAEALPALGRAVEDAAGRTKPPIRLVPDLHGDLLYSLNWLAEVLTGWGEDALEEGEEYEDPEEAVAACAAEDAIDRIIVVIRPTQTDPTLPTEIRVDGKWVPQNTAPAGYAGRLLAPDGQYEFGPVRLIEGITFEDTTTVVDICERIISGRGPLADAANEDADRLNREHPYGEQLNGAARARRVVGIMNILDRTPFVDENVEILVAALTDHDPDTDLVLTVPQAAAYQQWTTDTNRDLGGGPLDRYARAGISY